MVGVVVLGAGLVGCRPPTHDREVQVLRAHEAEATAMAEGLMARLDRSCSESEDLSALPQPLGPFSEACVNPAGTTLYFRPADDRGLYLAFGAGPSSARACLRQVSDRWWMFQEHGDPDFGGCPDGWELLAY